MPKERDLPKPITLSKSIGPSFILLGLALGSGELILWPYLVSQYGLGIIWGGLVGITFQYFLNTEIMRYSLAWGESIFVGWRKWSIFLPIWFILASFLPWVIPGIAATSAAIIVHLIPGLSVQWVTVFLLIFLGLVLSTGKTLYKTIETFQRTVLSLAIPFIAYLVYRLVTPADLGALFSGLIGKGNGWWFFPPGVAIGSFFGAFAYSGAGGNLNLAQSYYVKEKGMGMGKYGGKVSSLFSAGAQKIDLTGGLYRVTSENKQKFASWWRLVTIEHGIVFWGLGLLTICLLALLSFATSRDGVGGTGLTFLFAESEVIGRELGSIFGTLFLCLGALMLFATQLGVFESSSRVISENILLLTVKKGQTANPSKAFYLSLWSLIGLGIIYTLSGTHEPRFMITLGAILNAAAMMISFPLIYLLNKKTLPKSAQPGNFRGVVIALATTFFAIFLTMSIKNVLEGKL